MRIYRRTFNPRSSITDLQEVKFDLIQNWKHLRFTTHSGDHIILEFDTKEEALTLEERARAIRNDF